MEMVNIVGLNGPKVGLHKKRQLMQNVMNAVMTKMTRRRLDETLIDLSFGEHSGEEQIDKPAKNSNRNKRYIEMEREI